jgi:hypothetical protein
VRDVTEPALWSDDFADAFAKRIAWAIGPDICGSSFDKSAAWSAYQDALRAAKRVDAMENPPLEQEEVSWVTARFAGTAVDPSSLSDDWA